MCLDRAANDFTADFIDFTLKVTHARFTGIIAYDAVQRRFDNLNLAFFEAVLLDRFWY